MIHTYLHVQIYINIFLHKCKNLLQKSASVRRKQNRNPSFPEKSNIPNNANPIQFPASYVNI